MLEDAQISLKELKTLKQYFEIINSYPSPALSDLNLKALEKRIEHKITALQKARQQELNSML